MWLFGPLIIALVVTVVVLRADSDGAILLLGTVALCSVVVALAASAGWAWHLRDGLGPDAVTSDGWVAWARFREGFWPPLVSASVIGGAVTFACWSRWKALDSRGTRTQALGKR